MTAKFFITAEVATILAVSVNQVVALINAGKLQAIDVSTGKKPRWRIPTDALDAFVEQRKHRVAPPQSHRRCKKRKVAVDYFP